MREIKFRAWNKDENKMSKPFKMPYMLLDFTGDDGLGLMKTLSDEVIMQFTGLRDCNGVCIYDGDVVYLGGYGNYIVEFPFLELYDSVMENDIGEILGNTHQNPELL